MGESELWKWYKYPGRDNLFIAKRKYEKATAHFIEAEALFKQIKNRRGLINVYNSLAHAFQILRTKRGDKMASHYRQEANSIELNTHTRTIPEFTIQESLSWLTSAFDQHRDVYERELNSKAKKETERVVR